MKRSSASGNSFIHHGISLLFVVFIIVVLVTFAASILTTADNDLTLAEKGAQNKTDYYNASNTGEQILSEIDAVLEEIRTSGKSEAEYYSEAAKELSSASFENIPLTVSDDNTVTFSIPVSDNRTLDIGIRIQYPESGDTFYNIIQWNCVSTKDWNGDNTVEVYIP